MAFLRIYELYLLCIRDHKLGKKNFFALSISVKQVAGELMWFSKISREILLENFYCFISILEVGGRASRSRCSLQMGSLFYRFFTAPVLLLTILSYKPMGIEPIQASKHSGYMNKISCSKTLDFLTFCLPLRSISN